MDLEYSADDGDIDWDSLPGHSAAPSKKMDAESINSLPSCLDFSMHESRASSRFSIFSIPDVGEGSGGKYLDEEFGDIPVRGLVGRDGGMSGAREEFSYGTEGCRGGSENWFHNGQHDHHHHGLANYQNNHDFFFQKPTITTQSTAIPSQFFPTQHSSSNTFQSQNFFLAQPTHTQHPTQFSSQNFFNQNHPSTNPFSNNFFHNQQPEQHQGLIRQHNLQGGGDFRRENEQEDEDDEDIDLIFPELDQFNQSVSRNGGAGVSVPSINQIHSLCTNNRGQGGQGGLTMNCLAGKNKRDGDERVNSEISVACVNFVCEGDKVLQSMFKHTFTNSRAPTFVPNPSPHQTSSSRALTKLKHLLAHLLAQQMSATSLSRALSHLVRTHRLTDEQLRKYAGTDKLGLGAGNGKNVLSAVLARLLLFLMVGRAKSEAKERGLKVLVFV